MHGLPTNGWFSSREACSRLGISQPTFSRLVASLGDRIVRAGTGRATRYALVREISGMGSKIPVYRIWPDGRREHLMDLIPVSGGGFFVTGEALPSWALGVDGTGVFDDLPWFLEDLRPSGFIGRLVGRQRSRLRGGQEDPRFWSADEVLSWAFEEGADLPGALVVGAPMSAMAGRTCTVVRDNEYPDVADRLMRDGDPGSSAGGEQPKFLAVNPERGPVIVKFSPGGNTSEANRWRDLLVAEGLALETLGTFGYGVPGFRVLRMDGRVFLEMNRFDRQGDPERRNLVFSLRAVDDEFCGSGNWPGAARALHERGLLSREDCSGILDLHLFGKAIGNTDMHTGNLSLFAGETGFSLAPVYDMLPMGLAPVRGEIPEGLPEIEMENPVPERVLEAVDDYAGRILANDSLSREFRSLLAEQVRKRIGRHQGNRQRAAGSGHDPAAVTQLLCPGGSDAASEDGRRAPRPA